MDEQTTIERGADGRWPRVVFAVDSAVPHRAALRWIADHDDAGIRTVHVFGVEVPVVESDALPSGTEPTDAVVAALRSSCPDVRITRSARPGPIADVIVRGVDDEDDLLVLGSWRNRRGATVGRTPSRVAERASVPVVVVPDTPHPIDGDVVLAVDEPLDERAVRIAVAEATRRHRRLTLLRAWEMPVLTRTGLTDFAEDPLRWRRQNAELLARATAVVSARFPALRVHPLLVEGHPGRAIVTHTRQASLVVLGQGHVHVLSGSVLRDVLRESASPVCVVPPTAHDDADEEREPASA